MTRRALPAGMALAALLALADTSAQARPLRVVSLDQCADQYVMALAGRDQIAGVTHRADDADSWMRSEARGLPVRRVTAESILAARPDLVVRYWGGDARLTQALERRGVRVVQIEDATDFDGVRRNVSRVSAAIGAPERGAGLIGAMDQTLARSKDAWAGAPGLYLTPSGFTAGPGTLIDAILSAAGLGNAAQGPGYASVSLEKTVLAPPRGFVLGFFDRLSAAFERWGIGRHRALRKVMKGRTMAALPASTLSCPGWFAADAAGMLADQAPGQR
jgi:iron complex transport system substrate-binding protein